MSHGISLLKVRYLSVILVLFFTSTPCISIDFTQRFSLINKNLVLCELDIPPRDYWPTFGWKNSTPQAQDMNNETLYNMLSYIEDQDFPLHSVLIVKNGYVVLEKYLDERHHAERLHDLHSVTKSVTSTLIGIAIQQGLLESVNELVLDFFPEYNITNSDPKKDRITIEHLLTMTPGFEWDEWSAPYENPENNSIIAMMQSRDSVQYVLDRPMSHEPGEYWVYNGGASVLLGAIIQQISEYNTLEFAREYLFEPLGFVNSFCWPLPGGWYNTQGGLRLVTQDLAKLGFLHLNNGLWNGTQILPSDYVVNASTPIDLENPLGPQFGYGWHWWIRHDLGIYFAYGRHGQKIMIAPEHDLVVVFTAHVPDDGYDPEFYLFKHYILKSITDGPDTPPPYGFDSVMIILLVIISSAAIISIMVYRYYIRK